MSKNQFPIVLQNSYHISDNIKHLSFVRQDGTPFDFIPGQFINFHFDFEGETLQRSYSIACPPNNQSQIDVVIAYVEGGRASRFFFNLQNNDAVNISGPFGRLVLKEESVTRYLLIATGTGVAPYRSMLPELATRFEKEPELQVDLILGVRHRHECLYEQEFIDFAKLHPRFHFRACFSRESSVVDAHYEYTGRLSERLPTLNLNPEQDIIYVCGNPDMIDEVYAFSTALGFTQRNVRREKYVFSK